jgi:hypothetical protein
VPGFYDTLAGVFGARPPDPGEDPYGFLAGALKADPEGAGGFADLAGRSREARAAAGAITAPVGALDYMGKTLRGEEDLRDPVTGGFTNEAYGAAGTLAGVGMTGGIGGTGPGGVALGAGPIRAYHGSPHDFERFDLSKIGTGEGAQAYGHGLYFAENEGVARSYRDALSAQKIPYDSPERLALDVLNSRGGDRSAAIAGLRETAARRAADGKTHPTMVQKFADAANALEAGVKPPGKMYEVGIHADPARFLNWDKPLAEQPAVASALSDVGYQVPRNFDTTRLRELAAGDPQSWYALQADFIDNAGRKAAGEFAPKTADVSQALAERGIPGIRYLDAGSRGVGTGSSNYVVFDPSTIEILRKYGFLGPLIAGAATASMPDGSAVGRR